MKTLENYTFIIIAEIIFWIKIYDVLVISNIFFCIDFFLTLIAISYLHKKILESTITFNIVL